MLSDIAGFKTIEEADNDKLNNNQEFKNRVITIGTAIFNSYIERRGRERLIRGVLGGLAHGTHTCKLVEKSIQKTSRRKRGL